MDFSVDPAGMQVPLPLDLNKLMEIQEQELLECMSDRDRQKVEEIRNEMDDIDVIEE